MKNNPPFDLRFLKITFFHLRVQSVENVLFLGDFLAIRPDPLSRTYGGQIGGGVDFLAILVHKLKDK